VQIIRPVVEGYSDIYDFYYGQRMLPFIKFRSCTDKWKITPMKKRRKEPGFELLGIDAGESHRAKIRNEGKLESRYPLIEYGIDRQGCVDLIKSAGIPVPPKSGCFFCPMQRKSGWVQLRRENPDLFCRARKLEDHNAEYRRENGYEPYYLAGNGKPLDVVIQENQEELFEEYEYPSCRCEL
jgi:hypothetical protein